MGGRLMVYHTVPDPSGHGRNYCCIFARHSGVDSWRYRSTTKEYQSIRVRHNYPTNSDGTSLADVDIDSGFMHLAAGLSVGLTGLAAGYAIGVVGDVVRPHSIMHSTEMTWDGTNQS